MKLKHKIKKDFDAQYKFDTYYCPKLKILGLEEAFFSIEFLSETSQTISQADPCYFILPAHGEITYEFEDEDFDESQVVQFYV